MQMNSNKQKPIFDWRKFKYENIAVHVKTQEEYDNFMKKCKAQGFAWCTGKEADMPNLIPENQIEFLEKPTTHTLKLEECFCEAVVTGKKSFEIRKNDRGFQPGDTIEFIPVSNGHTAIHVISNHRYRITYVLSGWGLKNGYVALGIEEVKNYD